MSQMTGGGARFVGQRVVRKEDARFLTGHGQFVDDVVVPGALHAAFVRSDVARGRIISIDTEEAAAIPGVRAVYTADDLAPLVRDYLVDDEYDANRPWRILAEGDVRCVGEPIVMVIADSRYLAEDGMEAVVVEIEPEEPLVDFAEALSEGSPLVHSERDSNVWTAMPAPDNPALTGVLESAHLVMTETFRQHRYATVPMETRGVLANWDRYREELTVWISTQGPHGARSLFARLLGLDDSCVRVIMPDVGGSFGLKMNARSEELAVVVASFKLSRPVKWIQDRHENLLADDHAREDLATVTIATDEYGSDTGREGPLRRGRGRLSRSDVERGDALDDDLSGSLPGAALRGGCRGRLHEPDGPRVLQGPVDVRDRCARADDRLCGRSPRYRPTRVPSPERRSVRGPPLHDGHRGDLRSDHRGRDTRTGGGGDRL